MVSYPIKQFFNTLEWIDLAFQKIDLSKIGEYNARKRNTEKRRNALLALAEAYERCLGDKPTSAVKKPNGKPCFRDFMEMLISQISGEDKTICEDEIKEVILQYKASRGDLGRKLKQKTT